MKKFSSKSDILDEMEQFHERIQNVKLTQEENLKSPISIT